MEDESIMISVSATRMSDCSRLNDSFGLMTSFVTRIWAIITTGIKNKMAISVDRVILQS